MKLGVPLAGQRLFFGDRVSAAAYEAALARLRRTRRKNRRDRHRAVLRRGAVALRGPVGRRALSHRARADRLLAGIPASGDAADHSRRRARHGRRRLRRLLSARGTAARARSHLPLDRRAGVADGADDLYDRASARRSDRAQQPARHLYQFRQSARSLRRSRCRPRCGRRHAVRRDAAGARAARTPRSPRSAGEFHHATGLPLGALNMPQPPLAQAEPAAPAAGEITLAVVGAHLSGMPLNGELPAVGARLVERDQDRAALPALCASWNQAAEARACCA